MRDTTARMKTDGSTKPSELKIRENLITTLTRKFVDVMKAYQSSQSQCKVDIKKKVKRQIQIAKPDATVDEIDAVMKTAGGQGFLKQVVLQVSQNRYILFSLLR